MSLDPLKLACMSQGLEIKRLDEVSPNSPQESNIYLILNSEKMSIKSAREKIRSLNYIPIFSQNRPSQQLVFTVVPNKIDPKFKKIKCNHLALTKIELQKAIESTHSQAVEGRPIIIQGKELFSSLSAAKNDMVKACNAISTLVVEFLDGAQVGTALDLGCGRGANSKLLLEKGWKVIAIDNNHAALELFRNDIAGTNYLESGQLTLVEDDIVKYQLPSEKFNLALCIDVLSYIESKDLIPLVNKIHSALIKDGRFIGTLFTLNAQDTGAYQECMEKMGAHFYPGNHIASSLLEHAGFEILNCSLRLEGEALVDEVQFDAKKIVS